MDTPIVIKEATLMQDIPRRDPDSGEMGSAWIVLDRQNPDHINAVREVHRLVKLTASIHRIERELFAREAMEGRVLILNLKNALSYPNEMLTVDRNRSLTRPGMPTYPHAGDTVNVVLRIEVFHGLFIGLVAKVIQFTGR